MPSIPRRRALVFLRVGVRYLGCLTWPCMYIPPLDVGFMLVHVLGRHGSLRWKLYRNTRTSTTYLRKLRRLAEEDLTTDFFHRG